MLTVYYFGDIIRVCSLYSCIFEEYKKKVVSPSTNTTTRSRTRSTHKTLSPASKGNGRCLLNSLGKEGTSKSRRNRAPQKVIRKRLIVGKKKHIEFRLHEDRKPLVVNHHHHRSERSPII